MKHWLFWTPLIKGQGGGDVKMWALRVHQEEVMTKFYTTKISFVQNWNCAQNSTTTQLIGLLGELLWNILNNLFMYDEAHFHLSGYANKQNYQY